MREPVSHVAVAVLWHDTVFAERTVPARQAVTVGEATQNTLVVPDAAGLGEAHQLVSPSPAGPTLHLTPQMTGRLHLDGEALSVQTARARHGAEIPLNDGDWGVLDLGPYALFVQPSQGAPALARPPVAARLDSPAMGALLTALVAHFGLLIAAFLVWEADPALAAIEMPDRVMKVITAEEPPELPEPEAVEAIAEDVGKRAGGEEGAFGKEEATAKSKVPKRDGDLVRKIEEVGVHKALGSDLLGRGPLKTVFGDKQGFSDKLGMAMAGTDGALVVGHGSQGMGLRGTGKGGDGQGFGRVRGVGRFDAGGGSGTRARLGRKRQAKRKVKIRKGPSRITGFCKQADILRVVGARQRGVQYCYEKELARNPELSGKVTLSFRIALDGTVQKVFVEDSTLGSRSAEGCITRQLKRWRFPKPEGGMCQVKFPFVFNAGG